MGSNKKRKLAEAIADTSRHNLQKSARKDFARFAGTMVVSPSTLLEDGSATTTPSMSKKQRRMAAMFVSAPTSLESPASDPIRWLERKGKRQQRKKRKLAALKTSNPLAEDSKRMSTSPGDANLDVRVVARTQLARPPTKHWIVDSHATAPLSAHPDAYGEPKRKERRKIRRKSQAADDSTPRGWQGANTDNEFASLPDLNSDADISTTKSIHDVTTKNSSQQAGVRGQFGVDGQVLLGREASYSGAEPTDQHLSKLLRSNSEEATRRPENISVKTVLATQAPNIPNSALAKQAPRAQEKLTISKAGAWDSKSSMDGGTFRVKPTRSFGAISIPHHSVTSADVETNRRLFDKISEAIGSDDSDVSSGSDDENDDEQAEKQPQTRGSFCESFAQEIFGDTSAVHHSPRKLATDAEASHHQASTKVEAADTEVLEAVPSPQVIHLQSSRELRHDGPQGQPGTTRLANHRSRVHMVDITPPDDFERFFGITEPLPPDNSVVFQRVKNSQVCNALETSVSTRGTARTNVSSQSDKIDRVGSSRQMKHHTRQMAADMIAADKQIKAEAQLLNLSSEPLPLKNFEPAVHSHETTEVRNSRTQEGIAAGPQPTISTSANVDVERGASRINPGGELYGRGKGDISPSEGLLRMNRGHSITNDVVRSGLNNVQSENDDVYRDIDDITASVLGPSTTAIAIENCKPSHVTRSAQEAGSVLTFGGHRSQSALDPDSLTSHDDDAGYHQSRRGSLQGEPHESHHSGSSSSSDLSELSGTPSPPATLASTMQHSRQRSSPQVIISTYVAKPTPMLDSASNKKRKMTGNTSTHFSARKRPRRQGREVVLDTFDDTADDVPGIEGSATDMSEVRVTRQTRSALQASNQEPIFKIGDSPESVSIPIRNSQKYAGSIHTHPPQKVWESDHDADNAVAPRQKARSGRRRDSTKVSDAVAGGDEVGEEINVTPKAKNKSRMPRSKANSTGKISEHFIANRVDLYNTTASSRCVPAGTSAVPAPSINEAKFGIVQEDYWNQPFWLLVAVTLLNKTTGRAAVPVFKKIMNQYPTVNELAEAEHDELLGLIEKLGLQNNRTKTLLNIAKRWVETPPVCGILYRKKDYPKKGDGKAVNVAKVVEEDMEICAGAIEIGHLYGCGAYAYDSWRIFCRDVLRGVADDYSGKNAKAEDFEPEWKRVVPGDKELRACLRWMWLREGWIWDPLTGDKRQATEEEMRRAADGEMLIEDPQEQKFATQAAGAQVAPQERAGDNAVTLDEVDVDETPSKKRRAITPQRRGAKSRDNGHDVAAEDSEPDVHLADDDNIIVTPRKSNVPAAESKPQRRRTPSRPAKAHRSIEADDGSDKRSRQTVKSGSAKSSLSRSNSLGVSKKTPSKSISREPAQDLPVTKERRSVKEKRDATDIYEVPGRRSTAVVSTRRSARLTG